MKSVHETVVEGVKLDVREWIRLFGLVPHREMQAKVLTAGIGLNSHDLTLLPFGFEKGHFI